MASPGVLDFFANMREGEEDAMMVVRALVRVLPAMPTWLRRPFVLFSLEVVSSINKYIPWAELMALSMHGEVSGDASQLLWDLSVRKMKVANFDAPKPPPNGSTVMVLSGEHKGHLATVGIPLDFTPTSVSVLVHFSDKKMAVLNASEVREITPPGWQPIGADCTPEVGSLLWGATVKHNGTDGGPQAGPCLTVFDNSKTLEELTEGGYTKWLSTVAGDHGLGDLSKPR